MPQDFWESSAAGDPNAQIRQAWRRHEGAHPPNVSESGLLAQTSSDALSDVSLADLDHSQKQTRFNSQDIHAKPWYQQVWVALLDNSSK
jgi:hypothetical protein